MTLFQRVWSLQPLRSAPPIEPYERPSELSNNAPARLGEQGSLERDLDALDPKAIKVAVGVDEIGDGDSFRRRQLHGWTSRGGHHDLIGARARPSRRVLVLGLSLHLSAGGSEMRGLSAERGHLEKKLESDGAAEAERG